MKTRKIRKGLFEKPKKSPEVALSYIDPQNINPRELPTSRVSHEENTSLTQMLRDLSSDLAISPSKFPLEFLELMQSLSLVNPDVAQMVDNIVQLGNTGHKILIEAESDAQKDLILEEINSFQKVAFQKFGGVEGFVNSLLAQIARAGAGSIEWVVQEKLDGIEKAVFVPIDTIRFIRDEESGDYRPYQKIEETLGIGKNGYVELNTFTYQYCAIQLLDNSPYAVPPILAALEPLMIQRDIVKNFRLVAKKMGVLGLVSFLIAAPGQKSNETETAYASRLQAYIDTQSEALKKNFKDGVAVGYQGNLEVQVTSLASNATGAKEIHQTVEELVFSGLKVDPALMGRTFSTTETYAGVVYDKMLSMLTNYQRTARQILAYGYQLHLTLKGFKYKSIYLEFEASKSLSSERDEATYQQKLANLEKLYDQGIISQDQYAQEAGYDSPDQLEPRVPRGGPFFPTDPAAEETPADSSANQFNSRDMHRINPIGFSSQIPKSTQLIRLIFDRKSGLYKLPTPRKTFSTLALKGSKTIEPEENFDFEDLGEADRLFEEFWGRSHFENCGCAEKDLEHLALSKSGKALKRFAATYFRAVYPTMKAARNTALRDVNKLIDSLDTQTLDSEEFAKIVYNKLAEEFGQALDNSPLADKIRKSINTTYKYFRLMDAEPFGGEFPIKPSFNVVDKQAIGFMKSSDDFYFGRHITDPDTKKSLKNFLQDDFLKSGRSIRDPGQLDAFKKRFGNRVAKEDYKIVRVVETSTSRAKNWGNALTAEQSEAKTLTIRGPKDNVTCDWCSEMVGKDFKAKSVINHIKQVSSRPPSELPQLSPFLVGKYTPAQIKAVGTDTDQFLAQGIALPPYHPHCRHLFTVSAFED